MNLGTYFNLPATQAQLEFLDVKLDDDNELFVAPQLIENSTSATLAPMRTMMAGYSGRLINSIVLQNRTRAEYLLSGVREPKETRLGYGIHNANGKSAGFKLQTGLINAIWSNQVIQQKCVNKVSDLKFFIPNFSVDRISDVTTKVLKHHLIGFTQTQCRRHGIPMQHVFQKDILNPTTFRWEHSNVELPVYFDGTANKPIIFVPKDIVLRQGDGSSEMGYFFRFALNFVKTNAIALFQHVQRSGKNGTLLVKDIKASINSRKDELSKWIVAHPDIIDEYWRVSLDRIRPLTDAEIEEVVYVDQGRRAA